jgi:hypothetical protein
MMSHGSTTLSSQPAILIKVVGEPETALDVSPGPQAGGGVYSKTTELLDAASGGKHLMRAAAISRCSVIAGLQVYLSICNDWDDLSYWRASRLTIPRTSWHRACMPHRSERRSDRPSISGARSAPSSGVCHSGWGCKREAKAARLSPLPGGSHMQAPRAHGFAIATLTLNSDGLA